MIPEDERKDYVTSKLDDLFSRGVFEKDRVEWYRSNIDGFLRLNGYSGERVSQAFGYIQGNSTILDLDALREELTYLVSRIFYD